jgi:hypothetical protein
MRLRFSTQRNTDSKIPPTNGIYSPSPVPPLGLTASREEVAPGSLLTGRGTRRRPSQRLTNPKPGWKSLTPATPRAHRRCMAKRAHYFGTIYGRQCSNA